MAWFRSLAGCIAAGMLALAPGVVAAEENQRSHGISAFGGLGYPPDFPHFNYVNPDAPKGGVWSGQSNTATQTFDSFNPFIVRGVVAYGIYEVFGSLIYDSLMVRAWDEADAVYGQVALWVEIPEDRSYVIFGMRPEARFADGVPVTAHDVVFTLTAIKEQGSIRYTSLLADVTGVTAIDDHTVRVDFRPGPHTRDLPQQVALLPILPKHFYETRDFANPGLDVPPGSGPYTISEVRPGQMITYQRREDYWGKDLPVNLGRWNFDTIRIEYFDSRDAGFAAFKGGQFTFHEEFTSRRWATEYDFDAVTEGRVLRDTIPDARPSGTQGYWLNMRRDKFSDPRVREAIAMAFDFEWSNRTLFYNLYERTDSFFEGGPMQAEGMPSEAELALLESLGTELPEGTLEAAWVPPVTDGSGRMRRELRAAARLLDAAGWKLVDGKRVNDRGEVLTVEFLTDSISFDRITLPFIENLSRLGIQASIDRVDRAQYQLRIDQYEYDIISQRFSFPLYPGVSLRAFYHSSTVDQPRGFNLAGVRHPAVDALVDKVIEAKTEEEITVALKSLDRVLRALHIWVPHWNKGSHTIAWWDIYGRPEIKPPYARAVIDTWWYDAEKAARLNGVGGN